MIGKRGASVAILIGASGALFAMASMVSLASLSACGDDPKAGPPFIIAPDGAVSSSGNPGDPGGDPGGPGGPGGNPGGDDSSAPVTILRATMPGGSMQFAHEFMVGEFDSDAIVIRTSDDTCAAFVRPYLTAFDAAGTFSITGGLIGQAGGPPASPLVLPEGMDNFYEYDQPPQRFFSNTVASAIRIERNSGATAVMPFASPVTVATPITSPIGVQVDMADAGPVALYTDTSLPLTWSFDGTSAGAPWMHVMLEYLRGTGDAGPAKTAHVFCSFRMEARAGSISRDFLASVYESMGSAPTLGGLFVVHAGDRAIDRSVGGYFVVRTTGTTLLSKTNVQIRKR